jgi:hypothetical protein
MALYIHGFQAGFVEAGEDGTGEHGLELGPISRITYGRNFRDKTYMQTVIFMLVEFLWILGAFKAPKII